MRTNVPDEGVHNHFGSILEIDTVCVKNILWLCRSGDFLGTSVFYDSMLIFRVAYLGLLACLMMTTALGLQPKRLGNAFVEQETEADAPTEESGEEEVECESGIPARRRSTALSTVELFPPVVLRDSPRSRKTPLPSSAPAVPLAGRNGFGGPLRL